MASALILAYSLLTMLRIGDPGVSPAGATPSRVQYAFGASRRGERKVNVGGRATWWPDTVLRVAVALSLLAAAIHLWAMPEHFEEWWGYGAFFLDAALAQGLYALILLRRSDQALLLAGVAGNLAIMILWLVTRTTGIPFPGPHAGETEEVGALDLLCTLAESGVVVGLGALAMQGLATERRIQIVVVLVASSLLFWHFLHLLSGTSAH